MLRGGKYDALYMRSNLLWPSKPGRVLNWLLSENPKIESVLDLGCGDGKNSVTLAKKGCRVESVDISRQALAGLSHRLLALPEEVSSRITAVQADCCHLSIERERWDCIVFYGVAHCLEKACLTQTLSNIWHGLKPGGWLCFCSLNNDLPHPEDHGTDRLILRHHNSIMKSLEMFHLIKSDRGTILETHPGVEEHSHGVTWVLAKKHEEKP